MKVFVSSTLTDMMPYRKAARKAIIRAGLEPVLLEEKWGTIHKKGRQGEIAEEVKDTVADSDVFVLLVGTQYGAIIPGQSISWVELEANAATRSRRPFFLYALSEFPEISEGNAKSQALLRSVSGGRIFRTVTSPDQLAVVLSRDLADFVNGQSLQNAPRTIVLPHVSPHEYRGLIKNPEELEGCSPRFFEELIAKLLESDGWEVHLVCRNNAPGPDIIAVSSKVMKDVPIQLVVECKKYRPDRPVDVDIVRKVMYWVNEEYRATFGMIATSSYFTRDAIEQVERFHHWRLDLRDQQRILGWIGQTLIQGTK
jgi:hypothetical protein